MTTTACMEPATPCRRAGIAPDELPCSLPAGEEFSGGRGDEVFVGAIESVRIADDLEAISGSKAPRRYGRGIHVHVRPRTAAAGLVDHHVQRVSLIRKH